MFNLNLKFQNFLNTQAGKMQLATIIGETLNQAGPSLLRKCISVQKIQDGENNLIRSKSEEEIRVAENGRELETCYGGWIPQFEIGNNPQMSLSMLKQDDETLNILFGKTIEKVKNEIDEAENNFLGMFLERKRWDYYEKFSDCLIKTATQDLINFGLTPSKIVMHPLIFALIMNLESFELTEHKSSIPKKICELDLHLSNACDERSIYILPIPEQLGIILQRIPITSLPADNPEMRSIGYSIFESLGVAFFGYNRIQKLCVNDYFQMARMRNKLAFIKST